MMVISAKLSGNFLLVDKLDFELQRIHKNLINKEVLQEVKNCQVQYKETLLF